MSLKILVVDDDPLVLKLYRRIFSGLDYAVTYTDCFAAAAALIVTENFGLLVTDLQLGDGLGTELAQMFHARFPGTRCLLVTGANLEAKNDLDFSCISGCLRKPIDIEKFLAAVAEIPGRERLDCLALQS